MPFKIKLNLHYTYLKTSINVAFALFIRDIKDKIFEHGLLNIFSPLFIQLGIQLYIYYVLNRQTILGLHKLLFIVVSFIPFLLFERILLENANVFLLIKGSLAIKQIKVFHAIIANCFAWFVIIIFVFMVSLFIIYFIIQDRFEIYNVNYIIFADILVFFMAIGFSMIFAVLGAYVKTPIYFVIVFTRILYFSSDIFFPLEAVPYNFRKYLLLNPLLHLTELHRDAFVATDIRDGVNFLYPSLLMVVSLFVGLAVYLYFKDEFLKKAFE